MKTNLKLKPNSNRSDKLRLQSQIVGATHRTDIFFVNLRLVLVLLLLNEVWVGLVGVAGTIIYFFYSQLAWQHDNNNGTPDCLCSKVVRGPNGAMTQSRFTSGSVRLQINRVACVSHIKVTVKSQSILGAWRIRIPLLIIISWRHCRGLSVCTLDQYSLCFSLLLCCDDSIELNRAQCLALKVK